MYTEYDYLAHHGVKGMRWGVRRYQNEDGSYKSGAEGRYGSGGLRARVSGAVSSVRSKFKMPSYKVKKKTNGRTPSGKNSTKKGFHLTEKQKKALKIAGITAGTALAAYGVYRYAKARGSSATRDGDAYLRSMFSEKNLRGKTSTPHDGDAYLRSMFSEKNLSRQGWNPIMNRSKLTSEGYERLAGEHSKKVADLMKESSQHESAIQAVKEARRKAQLDYWENNRTPEGWDAYQQAVRNSADDLRRHKVAADRARLTAKKYQQLADIDRRNANQTLYAWKKRGYRTYRSDGRASRLPSLRKFKYVDSLGRPIKMLRKIGG